MPKARAATPPVEETRAPLCTGCTHHADGTCPLLVNVLQLHGDVVVTGCTQFESATPPEE